MLHRGRRSGRRQAAPAGVDRLQAGRIGHLRDEASKRRVIGLGGAAGGGAAVKVEAQHDAAGIFGHVLVDERVGEAREPAPPGDNRHLRLSRWIDGAEHPLRDGKQPAHPRTPTRTPRKRAGTDGWPVCPTCIGCPLPQFGVPQKVHSDSSPIMSMLPQKRGLIPV